MRLGGDTNAEPEDGYAHDEPDVERAPERELDAIIRDAALDQAMGVPNFDADWLRLHEPLFEEAQSRREVRVTGAREDGFAWVH